MKPPLDINILKSSSLSIQAQKRHKRSLFEAFLSACKTNGPNTPILTDGDGHVFTYGQLRQAAFAISTPLKALTHKPTEISVPKKILTTPVLPVLGAGKLDYVAITKMAAEAMG